MLKLCNIFLQCVYKLHTTSAALIIFIFFTRNNYWEYLPCVYVQEVKQSALSVVYHNKINKSLLLGIWATYKHIESVELAKLASVGIRSLEL